MKDALIIFAVIYNIHQTIRHPPSYLILSARRPIENLRSGDE